MIATTSPTPVRIPAIIPAHTRLKEFADQQRQRGFRLVTDGFRIYLTPIVLPGEFPIAEAA